MGTTILQDIKTTIGVDDNNLGFDQELLLTINAVKSYLVQLGVTDYDTVIVTKTTQWPDLVSETLNSLVKQYLILKTKQVFDPIPSETIARVFDETLSALEGRIGTAIDELGLETPSGIWHTHDASEITETLVATVAGATLTLDRSAAINFDVTLGADCIVSFANPPASNNFGLVRVYLRQNGTGNWLVTWPASVEWPGGSEPTISSDPNSLDIYTFSTVDSGVTWQGYSVGQAFA